MSLDLSLTPAQHERRGGRDLRRRGRPCSRRRAHPFARLWTMTLVDAPATGRIYRHAATVGLADVTPGGRARLDAVARWLQDAAWADVADAGVLDDGVWVVRRLELRVPRAPRFAEALELATFCSGTGPLWAERRTSVRGEGGAHVEAVALWVHLDADGTRPRPLPAGFAAIYGEAARGRRVKARLRHPALAPATTAAARTSPWHFRFADLDMAAHVNNAVYWTVLEEELAGAELPAGWAAEIEHRGPAGAGAAEVASDGAMRWILAGGGVVASLRAGSG
jgi:acyl-ACP thioesterase